MENDAKEQMVDARKLVGLLADETRLRVVAAIVLGASTVAAIKEKAGLDEAAIIKSLTRLNSAGLIDSRPDTGHRLMMEVFRNAARPDTNAAARPGAMARAVRDGRLPKARTNRLAVLEEMAALFETGKRYPEVEVNERLRAVNSDYALMRRYLIDEGFLKRTNEVEPGGRTVMVYWRVERG